METTTPRTTERPKVQSWRERHWDGLWASIYGVFWLGLLTGVAIGKLFWG